LLVGGMAGSAKPHGIDLSTQACTGPAGNDHRDTS
jgi:hypothetical protein